MIEAAGAQGEEGGAWRQLRRLLRLAGVLLHIGYGLALAVLSGAFFRPDRPLVRRLTRHWVRRFLAILDVDVEVRGTPRPEAMLYVSNHVSWLDIPVIGAACEVYFLSKDEVRRWPMIGRLAVAAGTLFIRRGAGDSGQKATEIAEHLGEARSVLVFPEGTTTRGGSVAPFFPQLFQAAVLARVKVQPVAVHYPDAGDGIDHGMAFVDDDSFASHLWRMLLRDRPRARLTFCEALPPGSDRVALADAARGRILDSLAAEVGVIPATASPRPSRNTSGSRRRPRA